MRIAAISDLHIGATARADPFRHEPDAFLARLDELERDHDVVVLLGDIWQCDHAGLPGVAAQRRALEAARTRTAWFTERIRRRAYRVVHGNHDLVAASALDAPEELVLGEPGFRVVLRHGHQFDPVIASAPRTAAVATWAAGRARAVGLRRLAEWGEHQDVTVKARRFAGPDGPYVSGARALLRACDAHVVVMGHTHVPFRHVLDEGVVANTGTCSRGRWMWVTVDTAARTVAVSGLDVAATSPDAHAAPPPAAARLG